MVRHFNVTIYIYNPIDKKFLFLLHKKINKWIAPGGHVEENENPELAAMREVKEETGLDIKLIGNRLPEESDLIRPYGIQVNIIIPNEHEHFDLIFLAFPKDNINLVQNQQESEGLKWFSLEEILDSNFISFDKSKKWCKYFVDFIVNHNLE